MDGKLTVEPVDLYSFTVNLIQRIIGVCIYSAGAMFKNKLIFLGRCY